MGAGRGLVQSSGDRVLLDVATDLADDIVAELSRVTGCRRCTYAGSLRRFRETIGDIDVLAAAGSSARLMRAFTELPYVSEVIAHGEKKTSVRTTKGLAVDLRVVPPDSWGDLTSSGVFVAAFQPSGTGKATPRRSSWTRW